MEKSCFNDKTKDVPTVFLRWGKNMFQLFFKARKNDVLPLKKKDVFTDKNVSFNGN